MRADLEGQVRVAQMSSSRCALREAYQARAAGASMPARPLTSAVMAAM